MAYRPTREGSFRLTEPSSRASFFVGNSEWCGTGGGERHVVRIQRQLPHLRGQVAQADIGGPRHGPRHAGLGHAEERARPHVVAALRPRLKVAAVLEQRVGLQHGGDAHSALERHAPHGRHAVARPQRVLLDEPEQRRREFGVERLGRDSGGRPLRRPEAGRRRGARRERAGAAGCRRGGGDKQGGDHGIGTAV